MEGSDVAQREHGAEDERSVPHDEEPLAELRLVVIVLCLQGVAPGVVRLAELLE